MRLNIISPIRISRLIRESISAYNLDLSGAVVLTEAANGNYSVTPVIAALAGARKVYAVAGISRFASRQENKNDVIGLARIAKVEDRITIINRKTEQSIHDSDIITNMGFVRPIDKKTISKMKDTAVIPLMYETWEFRDDDVNLKVCWEKGIPVLGTDESAIGLNIFDYAGIMCVKQLIDAQIEIKGSKIMVIQNCKFGLPIIKTLEKIGAEVLVVKDRADIIKLKKNMRDLDAIVIVTKPNDGIIIGENGWISGKELFLISPGVVVVQFFGEIDRNDLNRIGIKYIPEDDPGKGHMGITAAMIGPKFKINLDVAGLRIGEIMWRARLKGLSRKETEELAVARATGQRFSAEQEKYYLSS